MLGDFMYGAGLLWGWAILIAVFWLMLEKRQSPVD